MVGGFLLFFFSCEGEWSEKILICLCLYCQTCLFTQESVLWVQIHIELYKISDLLVLCKSGAVLVSQKSRYIVLLQAGISLIITE